MNEKQAELHEFQEILFWQQLNKQLIRLKEKGKLIKDEHHKYLQKFCFDNSLFMKITNAKLVDEIPLSLATDFSDICFITVKLDSWNICLFNINRDLYFLDIEEALAHCFDLLDEYDRKYFLIEDDNNDSDDQAIHELINKYIEYKSELDLDFAKTVKKVYKFKSDSIDKIISHIGFEEFMNMSEDSHLNLDYLHREYFSPCNYFYYDQFCLPSRRAVSNFKNFNSIIKWMDKHINDDATKKFAMHEKSSLNLEYEAQKWFWSDLLRRGKESNRIYIFDDEPLIFLEYRFPVI